VRGVVLGPLTKATEAPDVIPAQWTRQSLDYRSGNDGGKRLVEMLPNMTNAGETVCGRSSLTVNKREHISRVVLMSSLRQRTKNMDDTLHIFSPRAARIFCTVKHFFGSLCVLDFVLGAPHNYHHHHHHQGGTTTASSTSKGDAMPRQSTSATRPSPRSSTPSSGTPCSRTSSSRSVGLKRVRPWHFKRQRLLEH